MPYNRLAVLVFGINLILFSTTSEFSLAAIGNLVLLNFLIANFIRQQDVINFLFKVATSAPVTWPLKIRWALGKVYHFGGVHVGAFFSGTLWFAYLITKNFSNLSTGVLMVMLVHLVMLFVMMTLALPNIRAKHHDQFEIVARFGSWSSVYLLWVQTFLLNHGHKVDFNSVFQVVAIALLTFATALPWLRLRRVKVDISTPSGHVALTRFNYGVKPFAGSSTDISRNPLYEWHSFANIPSPIEDGFRLTISRAGDWTGKFIDQKPKHVWVKGVPAAGVGNIEKLFKKVVWVATGSGIGPCLPHLLKNDVPSVLVWSTKNPRKTYGDKLVDEILKAQPHAIIWDTDKLGKPDLVKLSYQIYKKSGAEAVICIANKKVTWQVNEAFETRGIPAFGAIWDS